MRTVMRKFSGQYCGGPKSVVDQSKSRIRPAISHSPGKMARMNASVSPPPLRKFVFAEVDVLFTAPGRRLSDIRLLSLFVPLEFERIPSGLAQPEAEFVDFFLQLNHAHFAPNGGAIETGQLLGVRAKLRVTVDQGFLVFFALADVHQHVDAAD